MTWLFGKYCTAVGSSKFLWPGKDMKVQVKLDQYVHKIENHYDGWRHSYQPVLPTYDNKIAERYSWKLRQPAYLDEAITSSAFAGIPPVFGHKLKPTQWVNES